jgi:bifunctional DNA-binding transcriptional regulator/antitoxin component of YhaV-PrlF toxin-antitoxin module
MIQKMGKITYIWGIKKDMVIYMSKVETKKVDSQGRISLPASWRKRALGKEKEVIVVDLDDHVEVLAKGSDLSKYIDSVEVDVESFEDYHALRKELRAKGEKA